MRQLDLVYAIAFKSFPPDLLRSIPDFIQMSECRADKDPSVMEPF